MKTSCNHSGRKVKAVPVVSDHPIVTPSSTFRLHLKGGNQCDDAKRPNFSPSVCKFFSQINAKSSRIVQSIAIETPSETVKNMKISNLSKIFDSLEEPIKSPETLKKSMKTESKCEACLNSGESIELPKPVESVEIFNDEKVESVSIDDLEVFKSPKVDQSKKSKSESINRMEVSNVEERIETLESPEALKRISLLKAILRENPFEPIEELELLKSPKVDKKSSKNDIIDNRSSQVDSLEETTSETNKNIIETKSKSEACLNLGESIELSKPVEKTESVEIFNDEKVESESVDDLEVLESPKVDQSKKSKSESHRMEISLRSNVEERIETLELPEAMKRISLLKAILIGNPFDAIEELELLKSPQVNNKKNSKNDIIDNRQTSQVDRLEETTSPETNKKNSIETKSKSEACLNSDESIELPKLVEKTESVEIFNDEKMKSESIDNLEVFKSPKIDQTKNSKSESHRIEVSDVEEGIETLESTETMKRISLLKAILMGNSFDAIEELELLKSPQVASIVGSKSPSPKSKLTNSSNTSELIEMCKSPPETIKSPSISDRVNVQFSTLQNDIMSCNTSEDYSFEVTDFKPNKSQNTETTPIMPIPIKKTKAKGKRGPRKTKQPLLKEQCNPTQSRYNLRNKKVTETAPAGAPK